VRKKLLEDLVCRDRGKEEYLRYTFFTCQSLQIFSEPVKRMLASVPPSFGSCVMMSAGFVSILESEYSIPAIAVLGDLNIDGLSIFKCKNNIAKGNQKNEVITQNWDGHCWVEVDGVICDLSIFRTAYRINHPSVLKSYITSKYGEGRGAFICPLESLPQELEFVPKFVLNNNQISGILAGLAAQQKNSI
jgi:hypothetical protein